MRYPLFFYGFGEVIVDVDGATIKFAPHVLPRKIEMLARARVKKIQEVNATC